MKILVIASHSGGHITPAIAFCQAIKEKDPNAQISFITTEGRVEKYLLDKEFSPIYFKKDKITFYNFYKLFNLYRVAKKLLKSICPDVVAGFGGYLSVPFIAASKKLQIANFIHEQNARLGLANSLLLSCCDKIVLSFPVANLSKRHKEKSLLLGNPVRKEISAIDRDKAKRYFNFDPKKFTIVVLGGSQGSNRINVECIKAFGDCGLKDIQLIHIAGVRDFDWVKQKYEKLNIASKVYEFFDNMQYAYSACDFIICRAGASTLTEIINLKIPALIIPYPYAKAHQMDNARFLSEKKACISLEEKSFSQEELCKIINDIQNDPGKLSRLRDNIPDINQEELRCRLADFAFELAAKK